MDPTDAHVWSSKIFLICFRTVEIHHTDRGIKLQFGILQGIPDTPNCMDEYHKITMSDQWSHSLWKNHLKEERRQWDNREDNVLQGNIMPNECKPSTDYMNWYRSVSYLYLSPHNFLFDPRNQPTSSNVRHTRPVQHTRQSTSTYAQQPFMTNQQQFHNTQLPFFPTQSPFTPNQRSHQYTHSPNLSQWGTQQQFSNFFPSTSHNPPPTSINLQIPQDPTYQTPQEQMPFSQPQYFTTPECYQPPVYSQMSAGNIRNWNFEGTTLSYGSATEMPLSNEEMIALMNDNDVGPSSQPQPAEEQPAQEPHRMVRRTNRQAPFCGTHQRFTRPGQNPR